MTRRLLFISLLFFFLIMGGCAGLQLGYEKPAVNITSFRAIPTDGAIPQFEIRLHIINPNRTSLKLRGISYTIALEGYKIMTGVSNQLPVIDAYGEGNVTLTASVDLFSSIGFITDLIRNQGKEKISYIFEAKLDAEALYPPIRITKMGVVSLTQ